MSCLKDQSINLNMCTLKGKI